MVHAVYRRGSINARTSDHDGGYWAAVDHRTPNWYLTADRRSHVLAIWHTQWRDK